jgi:MraZ protein
VEKGGNQTIMSFFFSGNWTLKLDEKGRFVLPSSLRMGLVEEGKLEFVICLGLGNCLSIYKKSDIDKIVEKFKTKAHTAQYQPFFTTFFSSMHQTSCDRIGRTSLPAFLKDMVGIKKEIVIAGVMDRIEIWDKKAFDAQRVKMMPGEGQQNWSHMAEQVFSLLDDTPSPEKTKITEQTLSCVDSTTTV